MVLFIAVVIASLFGLMLLSAYVASLVWLWFIVPLGFTELGVEVFFAVIALRSLLFSGAKVSEEERSDEEDCKFIVRKMAADLFFTLLVWLFAFIVHSYS